MHIETLRAAFVHIQSHLDGDLSLARLAERAGASQGHFHRSFRPASVETPKAYTQRLRIERVALRLLLHDETILDVAIDCGFASHETFTRAFGRRFGVAPRDYRRHPERLLGPSTGRYGESSEAGAHGYELSGTRVHSLGRVHLACLRHVGPYEDVPDELYSRLERWARRRSLPGARRYLGIGHDAPGITPVDRLRYDAALRVAEAFVGGGEIVHQTIEPGLFAVTTHGRPDGEPDGGLSRGVRACGVSARLPTCGPTGDRDLPDHRSGFSAGHPPHRYLRAGRARLKRPTSVSAGQLSRRASP